MSVALHVHAYNVLNDKNDNKKCPKCRVYFQFSAFPLVVLPLQGIKNHGVYTSISAPNIQDVDYLPIFRNWKICDISTQSTYTLIIIISYDAIHSQYLCIACTLFSLFGMSAPTPYTVSMAPHPLPPTTIQQHTTPYPPTPSQGWENGNARRKIINIHVYNYYVCAPKNTIRVRLAPSIISHKSNLTYNGQEKRR